MASEALEAFCIKALIRLNVLQNNWLIRFILGYVFNLSSRIVPCFRMVVQIILSGKPGLSTLSETYLQCPGKTFTHVNQPTSVWGRSSTFTRSSKIGNILTFKFYKVWNVTEIVCVEQTYLCQFNIPFIFDKWQRFVWIVVHFCISASTKKQLSLKIENFYYVFWIGSPR